MVPPIRYPTNHIVLPTRFYEDKNNNAQIPPGADVLKERSLGGLITLDVIYRESCDVRSSRLQEVIIRAVNDSYDRNERTYGLHFALPSSLEV